MAIKFLDDITLESNQIQDVAVENISSDPTGAGAFAGRIIYNTTTTTLKYYNGTAWVSLDGTGNVDSVTGSGGLLNAGTVVDVDIRPDYTSATNIIQSASGTGTLAASSTLIANVSNAVGEYTLTQIGAIINPLGVSSFTNANGTFISASTVNSTAIGAVTMGTIDLSAGGTPGNTTFLRGDNVWATPAGSYTSWQLQGDSGTAQNIIDAGQVQFVGGTAITTAVASGTPDTLTITHDNFGTAGTYAHPTAIVTNAQGHVTSVTAGTAPTDTTYTLPVTAASSNAVTASLTDSSSTVTSTLSFVGVANETTISATVGNNQPITIGLASDVTIANDLTVTADMSAVQATLTGNLTGTTATFTGQVTIPQTPTAAASAASKNYVDTTLAGSGALIFQGGYNASVAPPTGAAVLKGFTYVVTTAGDGSGFFTTTLEIGDLIIANSDNPTTEADWTEVQSNIDKATNTIEGISKFVVANGFASGMTAGQPAIPAQTAFTAEGSASSVPVITTNAFGAVTAITDTTIAIATSQVTGFDAAVDTLIEATQFKANIGNGSATSYVVNHALNTRDVIVQIYDNTTFETVQCKVIRTDVNNVTISTAAAASSSGLRVVIQSLQ